MPESMTLPPGEELIERVARAMCESRGNCWAGSLTADRYWLELTEPALTAIEPELIRLRGEVERKDKVLSHLELALQTAGALEVDGVPIRGIHADYVADLLKMIWREIGPPEARDAKLAALCDALKGREAK